MNPHYRECDGPDPGPDEKWVRVFLLFPRRVGEKVYWLRVVEKRRCFNWKAVWNEYREIPCG